MTQQEAPPQSPARFSDMLAPKRQLRLDARARRDALTPADRVAASNAITQLFMQNLALLAGQPAQATHLQANDGVVSAYWPIRSEVDALPLLRALAAAGMTTSLPIVTHPTLSFRLWRPGDPLDHAGFGTRGPREDAPECSPAIVLVPCLAFDRSGGRLGYGAGHFDRALERLRAAGPTRVIALAFAAQEVHSTCSEPHDQPLDAIVTEREIILPQT